MYGGRRRGGGTEPLTSLSRGWGWAANGVSGSGCTGLALRIVIEEKWNDVRMTVGCHRKGIETPR
jgi:hypothetical protein